MASFLQLKEAEYHCCIGYENTSSRLTAKSQFFHKMYRYLIAFSPITIYTGTHVMTPLLPVKISQKGVQKATCCKRKKLEHKEDRKEEREWIGREGKGLIKKMQIYP
jgi:hypothetical protein